MDEGGVPHDDLFPIELLELRAQVSILEHFGGRHPSMSEVARIPDDHLMKLSGFGPSTIRKVRSITQSGIASSSEIAGSSDAELRMKHDRLSAELTQLRDEFNRREDELQGQLNAIRLELRVRGLSLT
jgi:predicted flap endonuclease-1-like 5' DNA nuclease